MVIQARNRHSILTKRNLFIVVALLVLAALVIAVLELTHTIHIFSSDNKPVAQTSNSQATKGETQSATTGSSSGSTQTPPNDKSNGGTAATLLLDPSGNFVSAHRIGLSTQITSVCNTTAGANCTISFTADNGDVKALPQKPTDSGGSAYWNNWTPQSIGLTAGTWKISATATLNGQSKSAADAMPLVVSP